MSDALRLSVVVVSAGRPRALDRCLTAVSQMRTTRAEVIVVADSDGMAVARQHDYGARLTLLAQEGANISAARNIGIAAAAGEIVAFIDDDAVPEPDWAEAMLAGFENPAIAAATGPVIGRNGISLQWGRMAVDVQGQDRWLPAGDQIRPDEVPKLHGTNMAFRREILSRTGGFDTGFAFFLDETDLALRLGSAGFATAYLPGAVVHHGFAASARRTEDRVPLDLFDIGASSALFLRKHAPDSLAAGLARLEADQRTRLLRLARRRKLTAQDMRKLMESLRAGIADGGARQGSVSIVAPCRRSFQPLRDAMPPAMGFTNGWWFSAHHLRLQAEKRIADGQPTTVILLAPTPRKHRVEFTQGGWWEQRGGLFGPSDRAGARIQPWRYRARVAAEVARIFREMPIAF
ncbi:glycosyltransferase family 2 protein [Roseicyclus sp.]|uniref:glycosyltransferase family 2 protein n=1 Tax=Roseicyclus sp. TaxID=1914329 RepID=UPI003F6B11D8